jgi:hypothetical protein
MKNKQLTAQTLSVGYNKITNSGLVALAVSLAALEPRSKKPWLKISTLALQHNQIGLAGALALVEVCKANHAIQSVDLSHNAIPRAEIAGLRAAFLSGTGIRRLDLEYNSAPTDPPEVDDESDDEDDTNDEKESKEDAERIAAITAHVKRIRKETLVGESRPRAASRAEVLFYPSNPHP